MKEKIGYILLSGLLLLGLLPLSAYGQTDNKAHVRVSLTGFTKNPLVCIELSPDSSVKILDAAYNGLFSIDYRISECKRGSFHVLSDSVSHIFSIYLCPGKTLTMDVKNDETGVNVVYGGDTGPNSSYLDFYRKYELTDTISDAQLLKLPNFNAFMRFMSSHNLPISDALGNVTDSAFVEEEQMNMLKETIVKGFTYATLKEKNGYKMENDASFMDFASFVGLNDSLQIDIISHYLDWYLVAHPLSNDIIEPVAKIRCAKKLITNQAVLNKLAEQTLSVDMLFGMTDRRNFTPEIYSIFKEVLTVSTDEKLCKLLQRLCDNYKANK